MVEVNPVDDGVVRTAKIKIEDRVLKGLAVKVTPLFHDMKLVFSDMKPVELRWRQGLHINS